MNVFTATANLGRDAEVRHTASGTAIASFPIAISSGYGDNKKTTWVRCSLFGKRAEGGLIQYLKKGTQVAVSGEISLNEYTTQNGEQRSNLELNVSEIDLIGGTNGNAKPAQPVNNKPAAPAYAGSDFDDLEPPF